MVVAQVMVEALKYLHVIQKRKCLLLFFFFFCTTIVRLTPVKSLLVSVALNLTCFLVFIMLKHLEILEFSHI